MGEKDTQTHLVGAQENANGLPQFLDAKEEGTSKKQVCLLFFFFFFFLLKLCLIFVWHLLCHYIFTNLGGYRRIEGYKRD